MKTVLIVSDPEHKDVDGMMASLEHLFSVRSLPDEFIVITSNAPGAETLMPPIMAEAGFEVKVVDDVSEPDIMVAFTSKREGRAYDLMMHQWNSKRWVYSFHVSAS